MTLIVKDSKLSKQGLFTDRAFDAGMVIQQMRGKKLTATEIQQMEQKDKDNVLQVGPEFYLDMRGQPEIFINHSCQPNCYLKAVVNTGFLIALRDITAGEELTFDYSLTSSDGLEDWHMKCACHKFYCRKEISGFSTLSEEKKKEAIDKGMVPGYLRK